MCFLQMNLAPVHLWLSVALGLGCLLPGGEIHSAQWPSFISNILSYSPSCVSKHPVNS